MKKIIFVGVVLLMVFGWERCVYDFIAPEESDEVDPGVQISFATQILPVFTANCVLCHKAGGTSPDLSAGNAYASINSSKFINISTPSQSLLYRRVTPSGGFSGHPTFSTTQAALLLAWIQQGAKNN